MKNFPNQNKNRVNHTQVGNDVRKYASLGNFRYSRKQTAVLPVRCIQYLSSPALTIYLSEIKG